MIEFNKAPYLGCENEYVIQAMQSGKLCGDGPFTKRCAEWMQEHFHSAHVMLTTSCTHALEMAAYLAEIQPGDEVIMPSYTFVSTADAFVLRGAKIVFDKELYHGRRRRPVVSGGQVFGKSGDTQRKGYKQK